MDVWLCLPSANPDAAEQCCQRWRGMGYKVAVLLDAGALAVPSADAAYETSKWQGYPFECNDLMRRLPGDVVVCAGDDMDPDPNVKASVIAEQFMKRFPGTMGIMQPTGDPWMADENGVPAAARICGSPWVGRAWIDRGYDGRGAFWPDYHHFYADEELKNVSDGLGMLWQRPDLTQTHHHWQRHGQKRPPHMKRADEWWALDKAMFQARRDAGFPHHKAKGESVYSQRDEEEHIVEALAGVRGRFLDIGANDGKTFSTTHRLAELGWGGVCVEPSPRAGKACKLLYQERQDITVVRAAVVDQDATAVVFWEFPDALVSTLDTAHRDLWQSKTGMRPEQIDVQGISIDTLSRQFPGPFEFVNIDAEGVSGHILMQCPFDEWKTRCVCVEYGDELQALQSRLCLELDFRPIHQTAENIIVAR